MYVKNNNIHIVADYTCHVIFYFMGVYIHIGEVGAKRHN